MIASLLVFGAQFGGASTAFLWPNLKGAGADRAGDLKDDDGMNGDQPARRHRPGSSPYNGTPQGDVDYASEGVSADGIMPLYQRCVHLGCRVPFCGPVEVVRVPVPRLQVQRGGEYQLGPAPRGMDRFHMEVVDGRVVVDTSEVVLGPARGTDTIEQPPQGACVAPG